jgi:hypothetical protein
MMTVDCFPEGNRRVWLPVFRNGCLGMAIKFLVKLTVAEWPSLVEPAIDEMDTQTWQSWQ